MPNFESDLEELRRRSQPAPDVLADPLDQSVQNKTELDIEQDLELLRNQTSASPKPQVDVPKPSYKPLSNQELAADSLQNNLRHAAGVNPQEVAQRRKLANDLGVPKELLPDGPEAQEQLFLKENDPVALMKSHPTIAAYLQDLDNAEVAGQDIGTLKKVSNLMRRFHLDPLVAAAKTTVAVPQTLAGVYKIYDKAVMSLIPDSLIKAVDEATPQAIREGMGNVEDQLAQAGIRLDFKQTQEFIDKFYSPETRAAKEAVAKAEGFFGTIGTAIENPSAPLAAIGESVGPMFLGGVTAQVITKAFPAISPLVAGAAGEGVTIAGGTAQQITEETGEALTGQQALISAGTGVLGAGIGILGAKIAQKLGVGDLDTALARGSIEGAMVKSQVPAGLAKRILVGGGIEGMEELGQSGIEQIAQNIATEKPWNEGVPEAMAMGLLTGGAMGGTVQAFTPKAPEEGLNRDIDDAAVEALRNVAHAQQAEENKQTLEEFSKSVAESSLRANSPEEFKKFIRTMADEGEMISEVYVDAAKLDEAFAQSGITPEELQEKMPEVAKEMALAKEVGSEVRISFDDYATHIAGSKAEVPLLDHLRTTPEGMTYAESQQFFQGQEKQLTEQAKEILETHQPVLNEKEFKAQEPEGSYQKYLKEHKNKAEVFAVDTKNVHQNILDGLNATGRFTKDINAVYAVPFREFYATAAAKEGILPSELYERMPLNFKNVRIEDGILNQSEQEMAAKPGDFNKENVSDILSKTDWVIMTAHNPNNQVQDEAANQAANDRLREDLKRRGLQFEPVMGRYGNDTTETESFLIYGVDLETATQLTREYQQESALTREGFVYQNGLVAPTSQVNVFENTDAALEAGGYTRVPSTGALFSVDFQDERFNIRGVHFSHEQRETLQSKFFGTGIPGAERGRLLDADDPRIKSRVDFYSDTGNGITPEAGLGGVRHEVLLTNIYNGATNPLKFKAIPGRMPFQRMNDFETQVLDAGFDGYFVEQGGQGRIVVLGAAAENIPAGRDDFALKHGIKGTGNGRTGTGAPGISEGAPGQDTGARESDGSLQGLPRKVGEFTASHFPEAEEVARKYMRDAGLTYTRPNKYVKVDRDRAARIAEEFDKMEHNPQDPETKRAYAALIKETTAQYKAIIEQTGLQVEFVTGEDPYTGNPRAMTEDVRNNNHMWVYSTRDGFGTDQSFDPKDNPLLSETDVEISGQKALANDLFRMVHDYFGHVKEGVGFRADGEENAWRAHASMFSPLARRALTTETRGQNSWLNFGPFGETNRTAKVEDTHFADQKIGLLPEWVSEEGRIEGPEPLKDQFAQTTAILRGTETLKRFGLDPAKQHTTREVAAALETRQRKKYGTIDPKDRSPEALKKISSWMADEVVHEMENPENSGVGWYSEKFQNALDILGDKYPELKDNQNARNTMTAIIAVSSDGESVSVNMNIADRVYANYRDTGKFDAGKVVRSGSLRGNLKVLQDLYDSMGIEEAHNYLMAEMTVADLKKEAAKRGNTVNTPYQAHIKVPMAALELGPKLGAFYANLMGSHGYLTMDRWWTRTFNRYRGTLLDAPTEEGYKSFRELVGKPDMSKDEVLSAIVEPQKNYEKRGFKTRLAEMVGRSQMGSAKQQEAWLKEAKQKAGVKFPELLQEHKVERASNTLFKAAFLSTLDTPFNSTDRTFMLEATEQARKKLSRRGHNMSIADIQAVLWYYEKKLYGELGARQTAKISYEEAAQRLIAGRLSERDTSDTDRGLQRSAEGLQESLSPGGEDYLQSLQPKTEFFQFAGGLAKGADWHELDRAKALHESGMDNDNIRELTGWFRGMDKRWRFEIDDSKAELKDVGKAGRNWLEIFDSTPANITVGDLIDHSRLYAAYPGAKDIIIGRQKGKGAGFTAETDNAAAKITVGDEVPQEELLSAVMHEVQHYIQTEEGFARGGSPELMAKLQHDKTLKLRKLLMDNPEIHEALDMMSMAEVQLDDNGADSEQKARFMVGLEEQLRKDLPPLGAYLDALVTLQITEYEAYQRLAGEIEARNVQERLKLTPQQRKLLTPEMTQDRRPEQAIVMFRGREALMLPEPANIKTTFQQPGEIRAAYDPTNFTISLLKGADLSSVIHEGGHFYLEALADMAGQPNAVQQVKDDFRTTLNWFGINGDNPEGVWNMMTLEQKRQYHEQWAQSFERYNLEGKAPTTEMQPVFARFRAWMLQVYKSMKDFLKQNPLAGRLNDDIRQVFDRMLAADDAIKETEKIREYSLLFPTAEAAGASREDFQEYLEAGEKATSLAVDELTARSLRDMRWASNAKDRAIKALQREARKERKVIREQVEAEVMAEPINLARRLIRKGELVNQDGTVTKVTEHKLNTEDVKDLRPGMPLVGSPLSGMTKQGGLNPDLAAQFFGFDSGDALLEALLTEETAEEKINGITDQRMLQEHGDLVDPAEVKRAAEKAVHNEARARFMATGLRLLSKKVGAGMGKDAVNQMARAAKVAAETAISQKKVRELSPAQFEAAETKSNREAIKRAAKDPKKAMEAQRAALLNNRLARAASEAKDEVESALRYLKKFDSPNVRKQLTPDHLEQIDDLRQNVDTRKGITNKQLDKRKSLQDWIDEQEANGFEPAIDPAVMDDLKRKHYKEMTVEELRGLVDSIKQIEHIARRLQKVFTARDKRKFQELVDDAWESIEDNANRTVPERGTPTDVVGVSAKWARRMAAEHRKFNSIIREMDGGKDNGKMWNLLSRGMNEAGDLETEMKQVATDKISELFAKLPKEKVVPGNIYSKKKMIPGTNLSMTQEQRIMFGMNWGNAGNRQRLLDGGMTGQRAISSKEADRVLDTLTKEEWDFIQGVWDYIATYKPQVAALEKKLTGVEPEWVEPTPIKTKFGTYRGGYFPAKYDTELSTRSESLEAVTDLRMGMKGAFGSAATRSGYTKARSDEVKNRPLLLSYNVISQHVSEVTHRLSWQPWLIDANRLLKALDAPIRKHYGPEILKELRDTVVDIAQGDAPAKNATEQAINRLRTGSTIVGLGWRVSTAILQFTGLTQSMARIGSRWAAVGVGKYVASPIDSAKFADEKSKLMRDRSKTMNREINEILNTIRAGEKVSAFTATYFTMIGKMQRIVDLPTWHGAYEKALHQLKYENALDEKARKDIEDHAVALADQAVIDSQSGGHIKDLAKIQRGSPAWKLFTNFYSYFSAAYNLNIEAVRRTNFKSPSEVGLFAVDMLLINTVPTVMATALALAMKGGCDWEDIECIGKRLAQDQLSHFMGQIILLREMGAAVSVATGGDGYGYQGPAGLRFFSDLYKAGTQINQGEADMALFKAVNSTAGAILHYPAGQINSTVDGIRAIERGEVEGIQILPALISGPPRD